MTTVNDLTKQVAKRAKDVLDSALRASQALDAATAAEQQARIAQAEARAQLKADVAAATALGYTDQQLRNIGITIDVVSGRRPNRGTEVEVQPFPDDAEPRQA